MNDNFISFKKYFKNNIGNIDKKYEKDNIDVINEFNSEFPIKNIKKISLNDYIYEVGKQKTFCSKMVYHYDAYDIGPSIQSGSIECKFGIYIKNGRYVDYNDNVIVNPEEYFESLKNELVEVLTNISKGIQDIDYTVYMHLQGMWNVILKMAYYIKPDNNLTFGSLDVLKKICNYFDIKVNKNDKSLNLSYRIKKYIDDNISESKEVSHSHIGTLMWDFYEENIKNWKKDKKSVKKGNNTEMIIDSGKNIIYYGVPGCGKSWQVNKEAEKYNKDFVFRTVFHPDYTYTDFIGQIIPVSKRNKIEYKRNLGPFTSALCCAYENPKSPVLLIIEEINRGNAAAIFGDIFQLLDRNSDYEITNEYICSCLRSNTKKHQFTGTKFLIPNNLTIIATMNTSDQNVYTLDNAFRRRFEYVRVENDFAHNEYSELLKNTLIAGLGVKWGYFVKLINNYIVFPSDDSELFLNNEDKRLGVYSVSVEELKSANKFADKVLFYLWDNIGKYNPGNLFVAKYKLYDQVIDDYLDENNIFCDSIASSIEEEKQK